MNRFPGLARANKLAGVVSYMTAYQRMVRGLTLEEATTLPLNTHCKREYVPRPAEDNAPPDIRAAREAYCTAFMRGEIDNVALEKLKRFCHARKTSAVAHTIDAPIGSRQGPRRPGRGNHDIAGPRPHAQEQ